MNNFNAAKTARWAGSIMLLALGGATASADKAIYGPDNRVDEADTTAEWRSVGRSTVVLTNRMQIGGTWGSGYGTLQRSWPCPDGQRFGDQAVLGGCSGTLIAPDLIATYV